MKLVMQGKLLQYFHFYMIFFKYFRNCFGSILFLDAKLTDREDKYPKGADNMFYKLILNQIDMKSSVNEHDRMINNKEYKWIFYVEPDCKPIRNQWIEKLLEHVIMMNEEFWIKGSIFRGTEILNPNNRIHINGNAIYNNHDEEFKQFVQKCRKTRGKGDAFDTRIFQVLQSDDHLMKKFWHKFAFTEFVQNMWRTTYNSTLLKELHPNTYFVHGGVDTSDKEAILDLKFNFLKNPQQ
jgi:hypothetical protein